MKKLNKRLDEYKTLKELAKENGLEISTQIISSRIIQSDRYIGKNLDISEGKSIFNFTQLHSIDGLKASIETSYIPLEIIKEIDKHNWKDDVLNEKVKEICKLRSYKIKQEILIVWPDEAESSCLGIEENEELLMIRGQVYDKKGKIIRYFEELSLTELYQFIE